MTQVPELVHLVKDSHCEGLVFADFHMKFQLHFQKQQNTKRERERERQKTTTSKQKHAHIQTAYIYIKFLGQDIRDLFIYIFCNV
jgi:hypothetical protein